MRLQGLYYKSNKQSYFFSIKIWETLIYLVEQDGLVLQLLTRTTILKEILIFVLCILFCL
jgi:hypothetical protein